MVIHQKIDRNLLGTLELTSGTICLLLSLTHPFHRYLQPLLHPLRRHSHLFTESFGNIVQIPLSAMATAPPTSPTFPIPRWPSPASSKRMRIGGWPQVECRLDRTQAASRQPNCYALPLLLRMKIGLPKDVFFCRARPVLARMALVHRCRGANMRLHLACTLAITLGTYPSARSILKEDPE
eukprot:scaffold107331_cov31-Tisochrysis_lutea.AAC.2